MKTLDKFSGRACILIVLAKLGKQKLFPSKTMTLIFISMFKQYNYPTSKNFSKLYKPKLYW